MSAISKPVLFRKRARIALVVSAALVQATAATAGIHTWDVVEVFSNKSGTIQYVELLDLGAGGTEVGVGNGSLSSNTQNFTWTNGAVDGLTNGRSYLIATAEFAALAGAPVPDVIIPAENVPFFNSNGDTVGFSSGDSLVFGAVPINGTDSFDESSGVGPNTPKNYAGVEGNVTAPPLVPSFTGRMLIPTVTLLSIAGIFGLRRKHVTAS